MESGFKNRLMKEHTKIEPYRPSNGSEGMWFTDTYCMRCKNCNPDPEGEKQCEILLATLLYDVGEPEYPKEWVYKFGNPTCTAYDKWDWLELGDPDDPENPNYQMPYNPNQLDLFNK